MNTNNATPKKASAPAADAGVDWSKFSPKWNQQLFVKLMREAGLTTHVAVTANQHKLQGIVRECWQLRMEEVRDFARLNDA